MTATVHIDVVIADYLCDEQIVVGLLDEVMLRFLKCVRFILGDPLPTGCECGSACDEVLKITEPGETRLLDETCCHAEFGGHLIRTIGNTATISGARRYGAGSASACFILRGECAQRFGQCCA